MRLPTGIGSSTGGPGAPSLSIAGTWRRTAVFQTQTDFVTSETTWIFSVDGSCQRSVRTESLIEGIPRTETVTCTYSIAAGRVTIRYSGSASTVSFTVAVNGGSLFLDGNEFARI